MKEEVNEDNRRRKRAISTRATLQAEQSEERRSQAEQTASNIDICVLDQETRTGVLLVTVTSPASRQNLKARYPCIRPRNADHAGRLCQADNLSRNKGT